MLDILRSRVLAAIATQGSVTGARLAQRACATPSSGPGQATRPHPGESRLSVPAPG